jgi:hypothetical protein
LDADQLVHRAPLDLAGRVFETGLIVLNGQGLDVILRMSWMKWHMATLDISAWVTLHLPGISRIKVSLYHVVELKLEDIHIV